MQVTAKGWIVIQGIRSQYGKKEVTSARVVKTSVNKPVLTANDQEAIEIEITFPDGYFESNSPKIEVQIPDPQPQQVAQQVKAAIRPKQPSAAASMFHSNGDPGTDHTGAAAR